MQPSPSLNFLLAPRARWVDLAIDVSEIAERTNYAAVTSRHTLFSGRLYRQFEICWTNNHVPSSEYGNGLSVVHDIKDHYLYGLGITNLTEFQTIVQTYFGRDVVSGSFKGLGYAAKIRQAIRDELFGPRGSRVYDPNAKGLVEQYYPHLDQETRAQSVEHLEHICLKIMLPEIAAIYETKAEVLRLQASTLDQPEVVDHYLGGVTWCDSSRRLMMLKDNLGLSVRTRAYVDEDLAAMSRRIRDKIEYYVLDRGLERIAKKLVDTRGYLLPSLKAS